MYKSKFSENDTDDSRTVIESKGVSYLPLDFSSDSSEEAETQKSYNPLDILFGNLNSFSNSDVQGVTFSGYNPRYSYLDFNSTWDTGTDTNATFTKESFKARMLPLYEQALAMRGLDTSFARSLVAQDGLETRWGNATIGQFNYGNITGKSGVTRNVPEYINNEWNTKNQNFVNFASEWDYVNAKIDLLSKSRYDVFNHPVNEFAERVKAGGYATAPNYVQALNNVITSLRKGGVLKFDGGGKYLEQEREHYNQQVNFNSLLPVFNIPYNLTKHKLDNVQVKHDAPWLLRDNWDEYNGVYNTVTNTIHINDNYPNPTIVENHEKGHIIGQPLVRNVENLIKKWDGDIFEDGITKDSYYDSPKEILARMYAYLMDSGYGGNKTVRDTLQFIRDERDRFTTEINADLTYADGTRVRSTRKDGRVIVHDKNIPGTSVVSSAKIYRKYNDPYDIFNRYNDRFINDLFQLFYSMKRNVQLSRKGGIIKKYSIGGPIQNNWINANFFWGTRYSKSNPTRQNQNWHPPMLPVPSYTQITDKKFDLNQVASDGVKYYDIVKNRIAAASSALWRAGITNPADIDRLAYILAMQSIRETGWVDKDPKNNYGGYKSGDTKRTYANAEEFWDAHIKNLDDKWSAWRDSQNITEYLHTINDPDWYMRSQEDIKAEQNRRSLNGEKELYLYAPTYANNGKDYFKEVMDVTDRFTYYYNQGDYVNNTW